MRLTIDENCVWYAIFIFGYGDGSHFRDAVRSERSSLNPGVCVDCQGVH